jgi:hypothetical protein
MVKIYIKNISLQTIANRIECFQKYFKLKKNIIKLYSYENENNIYIIEQNNMYYLEPSMDEKIDEINYGKLNLLIDYSNEIKIPILSQLPVNYIYSSITRNIYQMNNLKLIIDGIYENKNTINNNNNYKKKMLDDLTKIFIPIDYYLEYNEKYLDSNNTLDFNNSFLQEELNVFLLHLI